MRGSVGSAVRRMSRWDIKSRVSEERPGEKLFILPLGMLWFATEIKALRSCRSERTGVAGMKGSMRGDRMDSISSVKPGQFALWKLVKVRLCDGELDVGGFESGREIRMGRWSELSVVRVDQEAVMAMSAVEIEMSGEDGVPLVGTLVGVFVLRAMEEDCVIWSEMSAPRESDREENQRSSWALKSPKIRVVEVGMRRCDMFGLKEVGQEGAGGM